MRLRSLIFTALMLPVVYSTASAQTDTASGDLMKMLDDSSAAKEHKEFTTATFKSTRIINGHSIENVGKGVLDFRISHRFGTLNQGVGNFFGLDNATTKLGFDYGITDWLMVGVGRSTYEKEYDGFLKVKVLRQREQGGSPVSISYLAAMSCQSMSEQLPAGQTYFFTNRLFYVHQALIARKFNKWLSLQIMPTYIHYNIVPTTAEPNDVLAAGIGGRIKLSNRIALTGEYYYTIPNYMLKGYHNSLSVGIDIETGGHVFQLLFTNSTGISERTFVGQTTGDWGKGDIHFGFNISRVFTIVRPKEFKDNKNW
jgi:hypothetical protein